MFGFDVRFVALGLRMYLGLIVWLLVVVGLLGCFVWLLFVRYVLVLEFSVCLVGLLVVCAGWCG